MASLPFSPPSWAGSQLGQWRVPQVCLTCLSGVLETFCLERDCRRKWGKA